MVDNAAMARSAAVLLLLAGCGRLAFDEQPPADAMSVEPPWGQPELWGNFSGDDYALTGDLLELYFNVASTDIYRATRASTADAWNPPGAIVAELDVTQSQSTPEPSADGLTMYFAAARTGTVGVADLWMTTRAARTDMWGAPVHVIELSSIHSEHPGNMTEDGLTIVFDSHRIADTDDDIFIATRATTSDMWGTPVAIAAVNETGFNDESPMLTPDGLELYFDSNRTGKNQIFVSRRASLNDELGPPEIIDYLVTNGGNQSDPWVSPDGHDLVFASGGAMWHSTR
jgi:Tol biopolymer transport system component